MGVPTKELGKITKCQEEEHLIQQKVTFMKGRLNIILNRVLESNFS